MTKQGSRSADPRLVDPVQLELFNTRFMGIAERMGVVLRNTSRSVNMKERLDFSCALFDGEGRLVANAPRSVHLGAMGESVRAVIASRSATLKPGDVVALNNPFNGGTHLPDVTVIAPVFDEAGEHIRFFVANRGHHADIGGLTPGSTPPLSRTLEEEGVVIDDFLLVDGGAARGGVSPLLAGARYPAQPDVNVADIKAQLAANATGIAELNALIAASGWPMVRAYMGHVMANAEESIRRVVAGLRMGCSKPGWTTARRSAWRSRSTGGADGGDRLYRNRAGQPRQFQRAAIGHAGGRALCLPLPCRRGDPAQRRLPGAAAHRRAPGSSWRRRPAARWWRAIPK
jgi:N-methylhydantoinase B/oxoprolinase/acetone carboxylase alpha subunit